MSRYAQQVWLLAKKDITEELRQPVTVVSIAVFCLLLVFLFSLSFSLGGLETGSLFPVLLWIVLLLASLFGMNRSFLKEKENDCIYGLLVSVEEPNAIFLGKAIANVVYLAVVELAVVPMAVLFWDVSAMARPWLFGFVLCLGTIGLSVLGTLFHAMTWQTVHGGVLLPILALPISVPLLLTVVELTRASLGPSGDTQPWLYLLVVLILVLLLLSIVLFSYILEV